MAPRLPMVVALTEEEKQSIANIAPRLDHRLKVAKALIAADLNLQALEDFMEAGDHEYGEK